MKPIFTYRPQEVWGWIATNFERPECRMEESRVTVLNPIIDDEMLWRLRWLGEFVETDISFIDIGKGYMDDRVHEAHFRYAIGADQ